MKYTFSSGWSFTDSLVKIEYTCVAWNSMWFNTESHSKEYLLQDSYNKAVTHSVKNFFLVQAPVWTG